MESGRRKRPSADEVIAKLKDEGDFDNLRSKIIRKIKENEELRNSIVTEVKQSALFSQDGSENLQPKQLSDSVYQEIGKKIMGQISDEVWKVIRSDENVKADIRGTVESVYNRIVNPEVREEVHNSPHSKEITINGKEKKCVSPIKDSTKQGNMCDESELRESPGFGQCDQVPGDGIKVDCKGQDKAQGPRFPTEEAAVDEDDDMPPGFGTSRGNGVAATPGIVCGGGVTGPAVTDAIVMPLGFGTNGNVAATSRGFGTGNGCGGGGGGNGVVTPGFASAAAADDDDDPDVPPGFG